MIGTNVYLQVSKINVSRNITDLHLCRLGVRIAVAKIHMVDIFLNSMKTLAVSIAFNEDKKIGSVLDRFENGYVDEIAVVDDGSTDKTADVIREKGATLLSHKCRSGAGSAIRTAIRYGQEKGYDILVILAGNDKDRPVEISRLTNPIINDGYDFIQGSRYLKGGEFGAMPFYRRLATGIIHPWLFSLVTLKRITDSTNGFRAIRLSVFDDERINIWQHWLFSNMEYYLSVKVVLLGYKVKEVPVLKLYPQNAAYKEYTKVKPFWGWIDKIKPLFFLTLGFKK